MAVWGFFVVERLLVTGCAEESCHQRRNCRSFTHQLHVVEAIKNV